MNFLQGLNPQQLEAVVHGEGQLLILAGAGSGKTKVLTHRIAYLILEKGINPRNILAITFTNKAAKEMKTRVASLIGEIGDGMWIGTFHSICVRILRREIEKLGYDRNFVIFDISDQQDLVKECLKELNLNEKNFQPSSVLYQISKAKDEMLGPTEYIRMHSADFRTSKIGEVYKLYQKKLKIANALDFDDIILKTIEIFTNFPEVLEYYQSKFKYILVDEYQDTNKPQFVLVKLLSAKHGNICVVGDDDQSIYGWRGADIRNILDFEKEFPNTKVIKLEQNYRSTQNILDAANHVIKNNKGRKSKRLWTENEKGELIQYFCASNEHEEVEFVINEINRQINNNGRNYSDFAILYRMNAQSRVFEEGFMRYGIPYKLVGALKFYERKEIKDILAYLRLIHNPSDIFALKRIINVPKRGIGKATIEMLEQEATRRGVSVFSLIQVADSIQGLSRMVNPLKEFSLLICGLKAMEGKMKISEFISKVLEKTGYLKELENEGTPEAEGRIENLREFISVAVEFERGNNDADLGSFLENISLVSDIDTLDDKKDGVILMTFHSAKGLEFPVVFMVGMEEGVFPAYRSLENEDEIEEERRLCYVGMTRAREQLFMTGAYCRTLFGNTTYNRISRFLKEIPKNLIRGFDLEYNSDDRLESWDSNNGDYFAEDYTYLNRRINSFYNARKMNTFSSGMMEVSKSVNLSQFKVGILVEHKKFGTGVITQIEEEGNDLKLDIVFKDVGHKRLMAQYAGLRILG